MYAPKYLEDISHTYNFGDECKYRVALNSKNGVVGSSGKTIPTTPNTRLIVPNIINSAFTLQN